MKKEEYQVHLELFEGPLDLLLYLVNRAEVAITDIKVSLIASQYLEYLDLMREVNIDLASEYLHMAAILIRLKSRELLPDQANDEDLGQEDGIFNRQQLIEQLLEYKKYKEAAGTLKVFESEQFGAYSRGKAEEIEVKAEAQEVNLGSVSVFDLLSAFKEILSRPEKKDTSHIVLKEDIKVDDRIEHVLTILSDYEEVRFEDMFQNGPKSKFAMVVTFMAILELVKMRQIQFRQEEGFGTIFVTRCENREQEKTSDSE
ncbi:Segregation and condensation protein A [Chitinispirillum alkaliphilum]|nr:Segregation and condensation protein A [Chitinispirillum alkaliphilum]